jgi:hypothetical protein
MTLFLQLILTCLCLLCEALLLGQDVGNTGDCVKAVTGRTSKRVRAPENPEETMRCTRQRAARQVSTTSLIEATEAGLEPDLSANQIQGDTNNTEQGKWLPTIVFLLSICVVCCIHIKRRDHFLTHVSKCILLGNLTLSIEVEPMGLNNTEQGK